MDEVVELVHLSHYLLLLWGITIIPSFNFGAKCRLMQVLAIASDKAQPSGGNEEIWLRYLLGAAHLIQQNDKRGKVRLVMIKGWG